MGIVKLFSNQLPYGWGQSEDWRCNAENNWKAISKLSSSDCYTHEASVEVF